MRAVTRIALAGAVTVLVVAAPVGATRRGDGTPAAAPFARAWVHVPTSAAARRARKIAIFGLSVVVTGFGPNASGEGGAVGGYVPTRGAFIQNSRGTWVKDLVTDARATKSSVSYTISPNAFWYWGGRKVPVTYRDFVYTLQQLANDPNTGFGVSSLDPTRFTHQGDKRVTFFWRTSGCSNTLPCGPTANWQSLFSGIFPSFALTGLDFHTMWSSCVCGYDGKPVSDGPFYLANYTPGQGTVLKANPYWGGAKPGLDEIDFRFFPTDDSVNEAMRLGEVDASPLPPPTSPFRAQLESTPGLVVERYVDRLDLEQLWLREGDARAAPGVTKGSSNVLLRAPWMRRAIMLGLDRQAIVDAALGSDSGAKPAENLVFFPFQAGYRPDFARWDYNPGEALAILKAHCSRGTGPSRPDPANTRVWHCAGLPATFRWTWRTDIPIRTAIERLAKRQLLSIGIALTERPLPGDLIYTPSGMFSGDFDIADLGEITTGDPSDWIDQYTCRAVRNIIGFCSAKVDKLLRAAASELNPEKRTADFQAADELLADTVPVIPLYAPYGGLVRKKNLLGIQVGPTQFVALETWHWRK
jgi:ABC-type transport system substrate-binding protein